MCLHYFTYLVTLTTGSLVPSLALWLTGPLALWFPRWLSDSLDLWLSDSLAGSLALWRTGSLYPWLTDLHGSRTAISSATHFSDVLVVPVVPAVASSSS